jgi:hypothetical protein
MTKFSLTLQTEWLVRRSAIKVKVKVKCTLVQALWLCTGRTAHRGSRVIALLFYDHSTRRVEGSASRPRPTIYLNINRNLRLVHAVCLVLVSND